MHYIASMRVVPKSRRLFKKQEKLKREHFYILEKYLTIYFEHFECIDDKQNQKESFLRSFYLGKVRVTSAHQTSSPKGNDAHLRVIIQSEKKWKHKFFRSLRAANSVVRGRI